MKGKIVGSILCSLFILIIIACGCNDSTTGSAYSSGPQTAGEGANLNSAAATPKTTPGTVAGGTATGGATSTGSTVGQ